MCLQTLKLDQFVLLQLINHLLFVWISHNFVHYTLINNKWVFYRCEAQFKQVISISAQMSHFQSQASQSAISFQEEYEANSKFVETLRRQTTKIQEMLAFIDKLKLENELQDKLIRELRKKQSEQKIQLMRVESLLSQKYEASLAFERDRVRALEEQLVCRDQYILTQQNKFPLVNNQNMTLVNKAHAEETRRLGEDLETSRKDLIKWKQKYSNCKQDCRVLRTQLQTQQKVSGQLEFSIKQLNIKIQQLVQIHDSKQRQLRQQINNLKIKSAMLTEDKDSLVKHVGFLQTELASKMDYYENQIRTMLITIEGIQGKQNLWKGKYQQLQQMVDYVELLRKGIKTTKNTNEQICILDELIELKQADMNRENKTKGNKADTYGRLIV